MCEGCVLGFRLCQRRTSSQRIEECKKKLMGASSNRHPPPTAHASATNETHGPHIQQPTLQRNANREPTHLSCDEMVTTLLQAGPLSATAVAQFSRHSQLQILDRQVNKLDSTSRSGAHASAVHTPPVGTSYQRDVINKKQFMRRNDLHSTDRDSAGSADVRVPSSVLKVEHLDEVSAHEKLKAICDPIGPPPGTVIAPPAQKRAPPLTVDSLLALLKETASPVYDASIRMSDADIYKDDEDPGYREKTVYEKDLADSESHEEELELIKNGLVYRCAAMPLVSREFKSRQEEGAAFASLHSNSSSTTPRSVQQGWPQRRYSQRGNGSPAELSQAAEDDELFSAVTASPSATSTQALPATQSEPQSRMVSIDKPVQTVEAHLTFSETSVPVHSAAVRPLSPTFGQAPTATTISPSVEKGKTEVCVEDDLQMSPTFGQTHALHNESRILNNPRESLSPTTKDARLWENAYAGGNHSLLRKMKKQQKVKSNPLFRYPQSDHPYPRHTKDIIWDSFSIKVVYERNRTGFQETRDFKYTIDKIVAGRYQILGEIGKAAFSTTFRCADLVAHTEVCLKVITNCKDYIDQSLDEIQILRFIKANVEPCHSRCLELLDYFYFEEHLFLVTELLGDNLYSFETKIRKLDSGRFFSLGRIQKIAHQILIALSHVHSLRLIHSDLKPENIVMVDESYPLVKLIDFGSACFEDDGLSSYVQSRSYRAPEVLLGLCYDQKIDIWSLGCVLAELWTGFVLFQNRCVQSMMARIVGILGVMPPYMVARGKLVKQMFTSDGRLYKFCSEPPNATRGRRVTLLFPKKSSLEQRMRTRDKEFLAFLKSLLQIDPAKRPTANEALKDPWLSRGRYADGL
eukprot:Gregarina_sp_Poly_1__5431@NODE_286_length_10041_cov_88_726088_g247_i0_p2_GENE_NODE_286_length_10041_cov_88_726088_g247_i0NODE_286_length_10041_cov_88_726088_g247_i0_p2_ORF_typecomplete_len860_score97_60Pkinase/PF00069_25/2_1e54Pkinase_Tyr/PF07714_17/9_1e25Kinaselike/PF14531_6/6_3e10Kdo/PF06293_14/8_9e06Pkinase_fungal/PF17667_1/3_3e05APH/PF01636_23/7_3e05WaaY/PF06176_11/0_00054RIO1/PF01163_22/0_0021FTA2/PF13095_6/0_079Seadorna_VP7/PF07387_11/0_22Seadorna_VP7/PF07387_11/2_1e03_NODE_286_length_1004